MHRHVKIFAVLSAILILGACNTRTLLNIDEAGLSVPDNVAMEQVEAAIRIGAADRGWAVRRIAPGKLEATIHVRAHMASVEITHDTRTFSIRYKDSRNLKYNGTSIHRNYNNWIVNLQKSILQQTSKLQ